MITSIQQMEHPLGIRFYKLHVDDFASGHIWCMAYKFHNCIIHSYHPSFNECSIVCDGIFGFRPNWVDCSTLAPAQSISGESLPASYSEFTEWLHSISSSFISV